MSSKRSWILENAVLLCVLVATLVLALPGRAFAAASFTVARTSAADFFIDTGDALLCSYASYMITNSDGVAHPDVWVKIGTFTGGVVGLNDPAANKYQIGNMNNGDVKPAFFYLKAASTTAVAQGHAIQLYDGDPDNGGTLLTTSNFTLTTVQALIAANANKITGGSVVPQPGCNLGQDITITLTGQSGTLGAGPGGTIPANQLMFTPAAYTSWPAKSFKIISSVITLSNGQTGTYTNQLALTGTGGSACDYTATYTLRAVNTTSAPTPVAPIAYINSGAQVKHTSVGSIALITPVPNPTIPTVTNGATLTASANPSTQNPSGTVTYTVTATDSGPLAITMNFLQATLAANFTYVPGSSKFDGASIPDPTNNANVLKWTGPFNVPSGGNRLLTFQATVPAAIGTYASSAAVIGQLSDPVCQIDSTADTNDNAPALASVTVANLPPPTLTLLTPNTAKVGATVVLTGTGFTGVTTVTFNGTAVTGFTVDSDTQITTTVPPGATSGNVTVTSGSGSASLPFTVIPAPVITTLTPNTGSVGDPVTITGVNFTGVTVVSFGAVHATFTFVDDTTITTNVPAGAGPFVQVTTPGGDSNQKPFTVIGAPTITGLNPTSGVPGTTVVITGTAFTGADAPGHGVNIGAIPFTAFTVDSDTQITGTIPVGAVTGGVVVHTAAGGSNAQTFTVPPPQITNFTPNSALPGATVNLAGQFFTGVTSVTVGGFNATFTFNNDGSVDFTVPNAIGNGQIALTTPAGTATTATFTYPAPTITNFTPVLGIVGSTVVLTGTHFLQASQVTFGGVNAPTYTVDSDTQITVTVPNGAASGLIAVTVPGGTADTSNCAPQTYTVVGTPSVLSFTPTSGLANSTVVITGVSFTGTTGVQFNGIDAVSFTVDSNTQITAVAPGGNSTGKISVTNAVGMGTSADDWTLLFAPTISGFSPTNGPGGTTVVITGAHFTGTTSVKIGGVVVTSFTVDSDGQISAVVANNASSGLVEVTTPNGTADSSACAVTEFTVIPVPAITGLSPNHGVHGTVVTITGSGFTNASDVHFGLIDAQAFTVDSDTQITATAPDNVITAGVTVTTPGGTSAPQTFTLDPPVINDFTPKVGLSGTIVTLTGSGFTDATNVTFNGVAATGFTVDNDGQLTATAPVGVTAGKIAITTLGGTAQTAVNFTLPVPSITSFTPTSGIAGTTVVVLTGLNFLQASQVTFGGVPATVYTVDSNTQITVTVPVGAASGPIAVTVPGGTADTTTLNPSQFTIIGAPTITGFTPTSGYAGVTVVTITGTTFTGATGVKFNGVDATQFHVDSDTQITVTCPVGAATGPLTVIGVAGNALSVGTFTVIGAPVITSFSPTSGPAGTTVTLTGLNFTGATGVTIGGVPVTQFTVNNDGSITLVVPATGLTGKIVVTTPGGTGSTAVDYKIPPTITSFSPQTGGPGTTVVIKGLNFTGTTGVTIGGVPVTSFVVNDDGTITAVVGANGVSGTILVTTGGGSSQSNVPFVVPNPPVVTSFNPTHGLAGAPVTVTGQYFTGATVVSIGGTPVASFRVINDTTITLVTGSGTTGRVSVTTPYGTGQSTSNFTFDVTTAAVVASNNSTSSTSPGGTVTLNSFQVSNTGTTIQTLYSVTIQIDQPSYFTSGTVTGTAAAGTVTATASPLFSATVFTFGTPLVLQPGESADIRLTLVAAPKTAAILPLLALLPLLGMLSRRTRKAAMMLALACVFTVGLTGCGGGGGGNSVGGVSSNNGSYQVAGNPAAAVPAVNVQVTQIVGKGPDGQNVNYPNLPVKLGQVQIVNQ